MSPAERQSLRQQLAWRRIDHALDVDLLSQLTVIREETSEAVRKVGVRVREGFLQIRRAEAALQPARTKPRDTSPGNPTPKTEPAFPAVNRGAG